jgi:hypothetical protein
MSSKINEQIKIEKNTRKTNETCIKVSCVDSNWIP